MYEGVIGGIAEILKNASNDRVATKTDISGPIEDPEADTWQVIVNLIEKAFFDIIPHGFSWVTAPRTLAKWNEPES